MGEIARVIKGSKGPLGWIRSGRGAVPHDQAVSRAAICLTCPKNGSGPLTQWFTEPASEFIKKEIESRGDFKLETQYDAALGVCEVCYCPLKTKVHEPLDIAIASLDQEQRKELPERCWIRHEYKPPVEKENTQCKSKPQ